MLALSCTSWFVCFLPCFVRALSFSIPAPSGSSHLPTISLNETVNLDWNETWQYSRLAVDRADDSGQRLHLEDRWSATSYNFFLDQFPWFFNATTYSGPYVFVLSNSDERPGCGSQCELLSSVFHVTGIEGGNSGAPVPLSNVESGSAQHILQQDQASPTPATIARRSSRIRKDATSQAQRMRIIIPVAVLSGAAISIAIIFGLRWFITSRKAPKTDRRLSGHSSAGHTPVTCLSPQFPPTSMSMMSKFNKRKRRPTMQPVINKVQQFKAPRLDLEEAAAPPAIASPPAMAIERKASLRSPPVAELYVDEPAFELECPAAWELEAVPSIGMAVAYPAPVIRQADTAHRQIHPTGAANMLAEGGHAPAVRVPSPYIVDDYESPVQTKNTENLPIFAPVPGGHSLPPILPKTDDATVMVNEVKSDRDSASVLAPLDLVTAGAPSPPLSSSPDTLVGSLLSIDAPLKADNLSDIKAPLLPDPIDQSDAPPPIVPRSKFNPAVRNASRSGSVANSLKSKAEKQDSTADIPIAFSATPAVKRSMSKASISSLGVDTMKMVSLEEDIPAMPANPVRPASARPSHESLRPKQPYATPTHQRFGSIAATARTNQATIPLAAQPGSRFSVDSHHPSFTISAPSSSASSLRLLRTANDKISLLNKVSNASLGRTLTSEAKPSIDESVRPNDLTAPSPSMRSRFANWKHTRTEEAEQKRAREKEAEDLRARQREKHRVRSRNQSLDRDHYRQRESRSRSQTRSRYDRDRERQYIRARSMDRERYYDRDHRARERDWERRGHLDRDRERERERDEIRRRERERDREREDWRRDKERQRALQEEVARYRREAQEARSKLREVQDQNRGAGSTGRRI